VRFSTLATARQGQGELCGVALEITSKVPVVLEVIKDKAIEWPRIESDSAIMVVGSAPWKAQPASRILS
jgi:amidase